MNASRGQAFLREDEPCALVADAVGLGDAASGEAHFGVALVIFARVSHDRHIADELEPRVRNGNDDLARAEMRGGVGIGDGHDDGERRSVCRRGEPFVPVDDVVIAVAARLGGEPRWIRTRTIRLGHREAASNVPARERLEPLTLLIGRAEGKQELHVAGVRGLAVEHEMSEKTAPQCFGDVGKFIQR